ncbi:uncharacterized protein [Asterias amurensis]|uniref:uncharacterized protein n=1 Tax=Asterias amurensis TaxID=7602 RepID=UPI003AB5EDA4
MNRVLLAVLVFAVVCQVSGELRSRDGLMREVRQALARNGRHFRAAEDHYYCGVVLEQNRESVCGVLPGSKRNLFVRKEAASEFLERGVQGLGEECCGEGCSIEEISESC